MLGSIAYYFCSPSCFWAATGGISDERAQTMLVICSVLDSGAFDGSGHSKSTNDVLTVKTSTTGCQQQNTQIKMCKCKHHSHRCSNIQMDSAITT